MSRPARPIAALLCVAALAGCRNDTVQVAFRPAKDATYRYETLVTTTTASSLEGMPVDERTEQVRLVATHRVLSAGGRGAQVRVVLTAPGEVDQQFVVRFDRTAQLAEVERIEGLPSGALADLGVSEIFPAVTGAPPDRRLAPGERWHIDDVIGIPGVSRPARLSGEGRLEALGVVDGEKVATVQSTVRVPLRSTADTDQGTLRLSGVQETTATATHDLDDGSVRRASARTRGRFRLELAPPEGQTGEPIPGRLVVTVRSETRRIE